MEDVGGILEGGQGRAATRRKYMQTITKLSGVFNGLKASRKGVLFFKNLTRYLL